MKWEVTPRKNAALVRTADGKVRGAVTKSTDFALGFLCSKTANMEVTEYRIPMKLLGAFPTVATAAAEVQKEILTLLRNGRYDRIL